MSWLEPYELDCCFHGTCKDHEQCDSCQRSKDTCICKPCLRCKKLGVYVNQYDEQLCKPCLREYVELMYPEDLSDGTYAG